MTKGEIEHIIRRFPFIKKAINKDLPRAVFYVGNRKQIINITPEVRGVYNIIDIICKNEQNDCIKNMISLILNGKTDINILQNVPYSKNTYYQKKEAFIQKVYNCCIAWNLVSFDEILMEEIA